MCVQVYAELERARVFRTDNFARRTGASVTYLCGGQVKQAGKITENALQCERKLDHFIYCPLLAFAVVFVFLLYDTCCF